METPGERLQWIRQQVGLNHKDFALSIGLSPSGYHTLLSRGSKVSHPQALAVEAVHGYCAKWILTGDKPKLTFWKDVNPVGEMTLLLQKRYVSEHAAHLEAMLLHHFQHEDERQLRVAKRELGLEEYKHRLKRWYSLFRKLEDNLHEIREEIAPADFEMLLTGLFNKEESDRPVFPERPWIEHDKHFTMLDLGNALNRLSTIRHDMRDCCKVPTSPTTEKEEGHGNTD